MTDVSKPMQKWEYTATPCFARYLVKELNNFGQEGWEAINFETEVKDNSVDYIVTFKRPKE